MHNTLCKTRQKADVPNGGIMISLLKDNDGGNRASLTAGKCKPTANNNGQKNLEIQQWNHSLWTYKNEECTYILLPIAESQHSFWVIFRWKDSEPNQTNAVTTTGPVENELRLPTSKCCFLPWKGVYFMSYSSSHTCCSLPRTVPIVAISEDTKPCYVPFGVPPLRCRKPFLLIYYNLNSTWMITVNSSIHRCQSVTAAELCLLWP